MDWDEPKEKPWSVVQLGEDLDAISIDELRGRIETLREEILRYEQAITRKEAQRSQADAIFKS